MITKSELVDIVKSYTPDLKPSDKLRLELAYAFAEEKHEGQKRQSGEPYFTHPLAVAAICAEEYELDVDSIIAALLHDVVEDTATSSRTIRSLFGEDVAELVSGLTKLKSLKITADKVQKAENYRSFVISVSKDIRVLIIKLIDRYHNISTLQFIQKLEKRQRIALETLSIYVPLAERMGMENIKSQMENVCFKELYPQEYHYIETKLEELKKDTSLVEPIVDELSELTFRHKIKAQIFGREKTPYSIWKKMQTKNVTFDGIFDIIAFRFIVSGVEDCYKVLGMVHSTYKMLPNRFKDYISTPKPNKYQSLHTTVIGPLNHRIEIQIRSVEMDRVAQYGYAAHWAYKQGKSYASSAQGFAWLRDMVDSVRNTSNPGDIERNTKLSAFIESVFCFTPGGDLITLPVGATALDFAYELHSKIGDHCAGVKINKVIKNIRTELKTGDEVEIITNNAQHPSEEWERFVMTAKARNAIHRYIKKEKREATISYGRQILREASEGYKKPLREKDLHAVLPKFGANDMDELHYLIGSREHTPESVIMAVYPDFAQQPKRQFDLSVFMNSIKKETPTKVGQGVLANIPIAFARCCHPVPGMDITGVIHTGKGVTIHARDCPSLDRIADKNRIFDVSWDDARGVLNQFAAKISVMSKNQIGALNEITAVIAKDNAKISDIKIASKTDDYIEWMITIAVDNLARLDEIVKTLKGVNIINAVFKV
jgi:GTP pyrophosphokinase